MHSCPLMDPSGVLPIDKSTGMTSHDVVDVVRRLYGIRRVGHTGTLDPAATGLLLILLDRATRIAPWLSGQDKTYLATVEFGATSDTGDIDGTIASTSSQPPTEETLTNQLSFFVGEIELPVPATSAVRTQGRRRYKAAHRGEVVTELIRRSRIDSCELVDYSPPRAQLRVRCSSGTYIRSLAQVIGEKLECGGYLQALRREQVGRVNVAAAYRLEYLDTLAMRGEALVPPEPVDDYLLLPMLTVKAECEEDIHHGRPLLKRHVVSDLEFLKRDDDVAIRLERGPVVAIGRALHTAEELNEPSFDSTQRIIAYQCVLI